MKNAAVVVVLVLGSSVAVSAQSYSVALVPDSLMKGARAVMREDETILEIKSPEKAVFRQRHVFTILNQNADNIGGYDS
ncbi:MAG TPA: hypothetical protein VKU83_05375, partial [Puia sp.]|nr:hypothetical protein [Puia sp.]